MVFNFRDYREFLQSEFQKRTEKNPAYSLRAFARDIGISAARLSLIFQGKAGLSAQKGQTIANALNLTIQEQQYFIDLINSVHARSQNKRHFSLKKLDHHQNIPTRAINVDQFRSIADWYHLAIVELSQLQHFEGKPSWVAAKLGITLKEAKEALARLENLGIIKLSKDGYVSVGPYIIGPDGLSSEAVKTFHAQILEKAQQALRTQSLKERDFSAVELAFNSQNIDRARERIREFRRSFNKEFGATEVGPMDSVYCLSLQLFNLTIQGPFYD